MRRRDKGAGGCEGDARSARRRPRGVRAVCAPRPITPTDSHGIGIWDGNGTMLDRDPAPRQQFAPLRPMRYHSSPDSSSGWLRPATATSTRMSGPAPGAVTTASRCPTAGLHAARLGSRTSGPLLEPNDGYSRDSPEYAPMTTRSRLPAAERLFAAVRATKRSDMKRRNSPS